MSKMSKEAEELRHKLEVAFAEVKYPGDERLVYDTSGRVLECKQVAAAFRGKHWRQIQCDNLESGAIFCLSPEAYRFYLPAYLITSVLHYDEADVIPSEVVFSLIPPSDAKDIEIYGQLYHQRMKGFTQHSDLCYTTC